MALPPVFVDTWALLALVEPRDPWNQVAGELSRQLNAQKRRLVTTEWVLTEFLNAAAKLPSRQAAIEAVRHLQAFARAEVIVATHNDWMLGLAYYEARADKKWSLVDCLSILVCQDRGIQEVFTGDHHFEQAGLTILLR